MNLKPLGKGGPEENPKTDCPPNAGSPSKGIFEPAKAPAPGTPKGQVLDFWTALDILANRWHWLAIGGILLAGVFFYLGSNLIKDKWTATAQLRRNDLPEPFKANPTSPETFAALIRAPELLRKVAESADPPMMAEDLARGLKVDPDPDSDMVKVMLQMRDAPQAVKLLNLYLKEAVDYTKELQKEQAGRLSKDYLKEQVKRMEDDIEALERQFRGLPDSAATAQKLAKGTGDTNSSASAGTPAPQMDSLLVATLKESYRTNLLELQDALSKWTEIHPNVRRLRERIKELDGQIASAMTNPAASSQLAATMPTPIARAATGALDPQADIIRVKLMALEDGRVQLVKTQHEAEVYFQNPPGMASIFSEANLKTIKSNMRKAKVTIASALGGCLGIVLSFSLIALVELTDKRLRTTDDVTRVTRLPVLTTLGDLGRMDDAARAQWAFRAWTMLQGRLSPSSNHGLVCGITSSANREGRSTWISLLAEAASLTGFRVLTIATKQSPPQEEEPRRAAIPRNVPEPEQAGYEGGNGDSPISQEQALVPNALKTPAAVTEQLTGPNPQPMVHIPLPGWVWNLERRREWRDALEQWRRIDNLVILVELPPGDAPEAVLLGSNLPNLIWLTSSGKAHAGETREQLATLRHARCNLVGAVLNREPSIPIKRRFPRWLSCLALSYAIVTLGPGPGRVASAQVVQTTNLPASAGNPVAAEDALSLRTNVSFSIVRPAQRSAWQQHLTLGAGDVLNLGLYGQPELARAEVSIGPDGRINFLEAVDVMADGLTVDELRDRLDGELAKYRRAPRSLITPVAFRSKRYYMLGKVMTKGVYVLDRPITVLEAIARAHGLENGLVDRSVIDLADFKRSFLARGGKRYPLNFEKLFQEGDLSQNIAIEPGDYIFFASSDVKEVYVVGEVRLPGTAAYNPDMTIIAAIAARGGYTDRAYKSRVLVVRGSLNKPELFVVDTHSILDAKGLNFKLEPGDIVYVNSRPFIKVEEYVDLAATAFIQSLITSWVGVDVVKPIQGQ
jgi:protein involved in polysaccharide export with SLBB domain/capsular polysaccharide biosynthesis protein